MNFKTYLTEATRLFEKNEDRQHIKNVKDDFYIEGNSLIEKMVDSVSMGDVEDSVEYMNKNFFTKRYNNAKDFNENFTKIADEYNKTTGEKCLIADVDFHDFISLAENYGEYKPGFGDNINKFFTRKFKDYDSFIDAFEKKFNKFQDQ